MHLKAAALLLAGLGATDWVDGYVARHFKQVSNLGKVLDPTADRLLLGTAVISILIDGSVPAIVAWPVLVREALVAGTVLVLAALGARRIDVTWVGKCGSFLMMTAFPLFLAGNDAQFSLRGLFRVLGWACGIVGIAISYYAAFRYIPLGRDALREGRREGRHGGWKLGSDR